MISQLSDSDVSATIENYENTQKQLRDNLYRIMWYMRGSISYNEIMYDIDISDFEILNRIIKENWETTNKTGMPLV